MNKIALPKAYDFQGNGKTLVCLVGEERLFPTSK